MTSKSILYVSSELFPYSPKSSMSLSASKVPKLIHSKGNDVRIFMPKFGLINERRHQLHEVIRLSGINLIINDFDQPLLIKVASMPNSRLQVYFIDNEEYFKRKYFYKDHNGDFFLDNDERALFFTKGVLEAVKKLNWAPDVIHLYGWLTYFIPLYIKKCYKDDLVFNKSKILISFYNDNFDFVLNKGLVEKINFDGIKLKYLKHLENPSFINIVKQAIKFSDAIIKEEDILNKELNYNINKNKNKLLDNYNIEEVDKIYDQLFKKQN